IQKEVFEKLKEELSGKIHPSMRRANLMVSGVALAETRGRILQMGNCRIRIWGETRPCEQMDEAYPGLKEALNPYWGGGVFGEVLDDGDITVGDEVRWIEP
ncbi:MAG: MOSC domain-containing protein, partial [candidate division Zixibacteria bacterium]|nr:MOSC domain-containing protein [candidate division Zixibacteria bacterium]